MINEMNWVVINQNHLSCKIFVEDILQTTDMHSQHAQSYASIEEASSKETGTDAGLLTEKPQTDTIIAFQQNTHT